jgi:hypothetical protein
MKKLQSIADRVPINDNRHSTRSFFFTQVVPSGLGNLQLSHKEIRASYEDDFFVMQPIVNKAICGC